MSDKPGRTTIRAANEVRTRDALTTKPRRGATIVLIAIVMTILIMFGGFGIDFARMYSYQAQLKVLTDASALSAMIEKGRNGTLADAQARAVALKDSNRVNGPNVATFGDTNVVPGVWNFTNKTFTAGAWNTANAVRTRARYTASWTLARIFGVTTRTLTQETIAAVGSQASNSCLKPFAIPYGALLPRVGQPSTNITYNLTAADIASLGTGTAITWAMQDDLAATSPPGSFAMAGFDPTYSTMTKNAYLDSIIPPGCLSDQVKIGDSIPAITGVSQGLVLPPLHELCLGWQNANDQKWNCDPQVTFQVPVYDQVYSSGSNGKYRVKYIAGFKMTAVDMSGNKNNISGFLTISPPQSGGSFSPYPGMVPMAVIVQ